MNGKRNKTLCKELLLLMILLTDNMTDLLLDENWLIEKNKRYEGLFPQLYQATRSRIFLDCPEFLKVRDP